VRCQMYPGETQLFTTASNETVRVDMTIITGSSAEAIAPQE